MSQWQQGVGNKFWMSCLLRTYSEPELAYNGYSNYYNRYSNYVIKSIFASCFEKKTLSKSVLKQKNHPSKSQKVFLSLLTTIQVSWKNLHLFRGSLTRWYKLSQSSILTWAEISQSLFSKQIRIEYYGLIQRKQARSVVLSTIVSFLHA